MNTFFDNNNKSDIGKLIHVGAGNGIELNDYAAQSFTEILLLEPIPKVFKQLESKVDRLNKINVHCCIAALNVALSSCTDEKKEKLFHITLPNRYSSLHKADKLKTLFQNLKTQQEITVSTINFSDLITKTSLDKDKKNALVLQINGAEFEVLAQAETDELMLFSSIVIQHSNNNYFENAKTSTDLIALMKSKGFQLAIETDNDVVFSSLIFRKDESTIKLKALTEQSKTQTARIAELENQLKASNEAKAGALNKTSELETQISEQNKNKNNRISELENQLKASNESKVSELTEARAEATAKANASAEQGKAQKAHIDELVSQLNTNNEIRADEENKLAEQNKNHISQVAQLESHNQELFKQRDEQAHLYLENKEWAGSLKDELDKSTQQIQVVELEVGQLKSTQNELVEEHRHKDAVIGALRTEVTTLKSDNQELLKQRDEQTHLYLENKKWTENLTEELEKSNQQKQAVVLEAEQLKITQKELVEEHKNKGTIIGKLESETSTLKSDNQELIDRQTLLDTEMIKVEAQLELIKDVVLREKAF
jgi:FkbM family methyltransferase